MIENIMMKKIKIIIMKNYNNNNYFNSSSYEAKMDLKWEEIRKLNKKMDNLLLKNKNKL